MKRNNKKEKAVSAAGCASGAASILGSWQICHSLCLGVIAFLSIFGIVINGMPFLFLTDLALPFWSIAVALLAITSFMYFYRKCISRNLILLNIGLIIAGFPFQNPFLPVFWAVGGIIAITSIILFFKKRIEKR
ncbi:MAG: hypothetical protein J4473_06190 [Candidatus Aenigmarchaeota archaeon]|nr:hypothetical protein [Candidatus Aenigmarchaeota archaeon]